MRRFLSVVIFAAMLFVPVLGLAAACGSDDGSTETEQGLPAVSGGGFGEKPSVTAPDGQQPATQLVSKTLSEGDGTAVKKGDLLVAHYLGQTWRENKVFDNSFDRGAPTGFVIGTGQVIPGWDESLVGVKAGSRVELVVPPEKGYGAEGQPQAGIKGDDTLVFVVDVIASYGKDAVGQADAAPQQVATGLPTVTGELGARPKLAVAKGVKPPAKPDTVVVAQGTGKPVEKGALLVAQFEAVSWAGKAVGSTWQQGLPQGVPVGVEGQPSPFDQLAGVPVGSRVLLLLPPQQGGTPAKDSLAVVVDVVAQHA
jgi:peptidylprolyl isomerase